VPEHDRIAEAAAEGRQHLRRERDLGDHGQYLPAVGQDARGGLEVHLGLAAPGDAEEEEDLMGRFGEDRLDGVERPALVTVSGRACARLDANSLLDRERVGRNDIGFGCSLPSPPRRVPERLDTAGSAALIASPRSRGSSRRASG
jgi:hypothetical protein